MVTATGITSLGAAFAAFGYGLRHGQTILKTLVATSTLLCLGVGVLGLFLEEMFMCICGFIAFAISCMYANTVWRRLEVSVYGSITPKISMFDLS